MKKYLITGALSLVASATFISCHTDDDFGSSIVEQKMLAYEQVFEEEFGKVDPNQDWGFGTAERLSRTRSAYAGRTRADGDHEGDGNTEHNQWGACDNIYKLDVPPALTEGQKLRVQKYFQAHPYLTYEDPHLEDFFVQQVYKGNPATAGALSPEEYSTGNGETVKSSDHMDWLTVGNNNMHVNDFNFGTFDHGNTTTVINTGVKQNDYEIPGNTHQDQITLMLDASTECVGFSVSNGTIHHNDCCALAKAKAIDDWALDEANWVNGKPIGENVWYEGRDENGNVIDNQKWNRSFVGLDYEQKTLEDCYGVVYVNGQPYSPVYAKVGDGPQFDYVWDGTRFWAWNDIKDEYLYLVDNNGNFILDENGQKQKVVYVTSDTNEICATNADYDQQSDLTRNFTKADFAAKGVTISNNDAWVFDLTKVYDKLKANCMPAINGNLQKWIKDIGGRDYVYSDWIVTLTPALPQGNVQPNTIEIPIEPGSEGSVYRKDFYYKQTSYEENGSGRVFCEDLGVVRASDIDFNDIVFDVYIYKTLFYTEHKISTDGETWILDPELGANAVEYTDSTFNGDVWLLAGGGTIPASIQVAGNSYSIKNVYGDPDITDKWIINTIENDEGRYGNQYKIIQRGVKLNDEPLAITSVADVDVYVTYDGHVGKLVAYKGAAPHKICVPIGTKWLKEREEINLGYPSFDKYVKSQDINGKYIDHEGVIPYNGPEGGYIGDGDKYNNNYDRAFDYVWEETAETSTHLYSLPVPYTPRHLSQGWDGSIISLGSGNASGGGSSSGFQNGDPVLIRVRH
jgi:hypothetical protein